MESESTLRERVRDSITNIQRDYHYVIVDGEIGDTRFPTGMTFMCLSYLLDKTHLLVGDPGWGKTTGAQLVASVLSGQPFDLYESLIISGHAGMFEEKMIGRPDYGALSEGKEQVIWQGGLSLDALIVDEINRIPEGAQGALLEGIRTGRWTYLNDVLYEGEKPVFLTQNYEDRGTGTLIPPLADRFEIVTEKRPTNPTWDFETTDKRVREDLAHPRHTERAMEALRTRNVKSDEEEQPGFDELLDERPVDDHLTLEEKNQIQAEIRNLDFTNDARLFLWAFMAEINFSDKYGVKRSEDPISDNPHDANYAGAQVTTPMSPRAKMATNEYARGIAWLLGVESVEVDHIRFVLPYTIAHRLEFTEAYADRHADEHREDFEDLALAKRLVSEVYDRYTGSDELGIAPEVKDLTAQVQQGDIDPGDLDPEEYDHPLFKYMIADSQAEELIDWNS